MGGPGDLRVELPLAAPQLGATEEGAPTVGLAPVSEQQGGRRR